MLLENCVALDEKRLANELRHGFDDLTYPDRVSIAHGFISAAKLIVVEIVVVAPALATSPALLPRLPLSWIGCRVMALTRNANKMPPLASRDTNITAVELTGDRETDVAAVRTLLPSTKAMGFALRNNLKKEKQPPKKQKLKTKIFHISQKSDEGSR